MAGIGQQDRLRNTFWEVESSFAQVPLSVTQVWPQGVVEDDRSQTEIEIDDETVYLNDKKPTILGLKGGGCKLKLAVRPPAAQLDTAATGAALNTAPNNKGFKALWGGEQINAGSAIVSAADATHITVTGGHGARFTPGQVILVGVSGVLYPTVIASISTDTLTLALALPGTPAAAQKVINLHHYFFDDANVQSLYVRDVVQAPSNDEQIEYLGCIGDGEFGFDRNGAFTTSWDIKAGNWNGPASLGYGAPAFAADPQGTTFAVVNATTLLQPLATTTTTQYPFAKIAGKFTGGMMHRDEHGGINGHTGVMRGGPKLAGEITLTVERDTQIETWRQNKTPLRLLYLLSQGSGTLIRVAGIHLPYCVVTDVEKIRGENERRLYEVKLRALMDTSFGTKLGRGPIQHIVG